MKKYTYRTTARVQLTYDIYAKSSVEAREKIEQVPFGDYRAIELEEVIQNDIEQIQDMDDDEPQEMPFEHDCHASPDDGCSACEKLRAGEAGE